MSALTMSDTPLLAEVLWRQSRNFLLLNKGRVQDPCNAMSVIPALSRQRTCSYITKLSIRMDATVDVVIVRRSRTVPPHLSSLSPRGSRAFVRPLRAPVHQRFFWCSMACSQAVTRYLSCGCLLLDRARRCRRDRGPVHGVGVRHAAKTARPRPSQEFPALGVRRIADVSHRCRHRQRVRPLSCSRSNRIRWFLTLRRATPCETCPRERARRMDLSKSIFPSHGELYGVVRSIVAVLVAQR